jgi:hypothetical protein
MPSCCGVKEWILIRNKIDFWVTVSMVYYIWITDLYFNILDWIFKIGSIWIPIWIMKINLFANPYFSCIYYHRLGQYEASMPLNKKGMNLLFLIHIMLILVEWFLLSSRLFFVNWSLWIDFIINLKIGIWN